MRAVPVRAVGTLVGTWLVVEGGQRAVAIVIATAVLLAVASSLTGLKVRPTRRNQLIAGGVAGVSGTVAGIGGPPMAITYQYEDAGVLRASLAAFNAVSIVALSIPLLVIADVIGWREVQLAIVLVAGRVRRPVGRQAPRSRGCIPSECGTWCCACAQRRRSSCW